MLKRLLRQGRHSMRRHSGGHASVRIGVRHSTQDSFDVEDESDEIEFAKTIRKQKKDHKQSVDESEYNQQTSFGDTHIRAPEACYTMKDANTMEMTRLDTYVCIDYAYGVYTATAIHEELGRTCFSVRDINTEHPEPGPELEKEKEKD
jgi:hypothetical protein